jgi:hypothetical protein
MAKRPLRTYKTYGFRVYMYRNQKGKGLKREGVIVFLDEHGKQIKQVQFDYLDEIPILIRKRLQQLEKLEKA